MIFTEMSNFTDGTNDDGNHFGKMYHIFCLMSKHFRLLRVFHSLECGACMLYQCERSFFHLMPKHFIVDG